MQLKTAKVKSCCADKPGTSDSTALSGGSPATPAPSPGGLDIRAIRASLRLLEREIGDTLSSQTACCAVTVSQCHVLTELDGAGCVNLTTLAARMRLDKSTLSRGVDSLVTEGLVDRSTDPDNRRSQIICLSPAGQERVNGIHTVCDRYYERLFARIPADKQTMVAESLALLADAMAATNQEEKHGCD